MCVCVKYQENNASEKVHSEIVQSILENIKQERERMQAVESHPRKTRPGVGGVCVVYIPELPYPHDAQ